MKRQIKGIIEHVASRLGPHTRKGGAPRLWVLMYHRILPASDPRFAQEEPGMIVTPDSFRQQLKILRQLFELIPLSEWIERRNAGKPLPARACAVTFDDGWLDNYEYALPILQQEQVPATLFAVSHMICTGRQFWPNRLARVLAAAGDRVQLPWLPGYRAGETVDRERAAHLILQCKQLGDDVINGHLDSAEAQLQLSTVAEPALMNWNQLRAMRQSGFVEVGSHTCNHYRLLATLPPALVAQEIRDSKQLLEAELEQPVKLFCYPNGDVCPAAIELVRANYLAAVTTRRGINTADAPAHELLRIGIHQDISDTPTRFQARLSGWL